MNIEPHVPVDLRQESVLCQPHQVVLYNGAATARGDLANPSSPFLGFLKTLDPNKCFIVAFMDIENKQATDLFYEAQRVARDVGIHMQGTVAPYPQQLAQWESYRKVRRLEQPSVDKPRA